MRLAFFLDNRGIAERGGLSDPRLGNPGIGGTEFAFLAVVAQLAADGPLQPLLLLTAPQSIDGIPASAMAVVDGLSSAIDLAADQGAEALVFRPGFHDRTDWQALETSSLPLIAWLHNLGCHDQARYEALPALWRWVLVSGAQLDFFRHSRLARKAVVIPNPVAVPPASRQPRTLEQAAAAKDLAYVGAITPFKAFDRLARQWPRIARACPDAYLRVFGGADLYGGAGPVSLSAYEQHCLALLERGGYGDRVSFEGRSGLERYDAFDQVAVGVVNPSGRDETFCLSAAEFNACGIPVVAPRRHALVQTVLEGQSGLLASSDQQLADHCIALLQQPSWSWQLGQAGQRSCQERFAAQNVAAAWRDLIRQLASAEAPAPPKPSTSWIHEQRLLRQLWGQALRIPGWPSWPTLKSWLKGGQAPLGPKAVGVLAGLMALLIWALLVFGKYGGNPTGLARVGDQLPLSPLLADQPVVRLAGKRGNDGQQFLSLALDPLQLEAGTSAALDNPIYRGKRLLYPLLAYLAGLGQPQLIVWTLGLLNVACIGCAAGLVAAWAQLQQRSAGWGLAVLALPGYWITLSLSTADLLATTLLLAAALTASQVRLLPHWLSLIAASLTRETGLIAWAASGLTALQERRWRWLLPLAVVPLPLLLWSSVLARRFAAVPDGALARLHFGFPAAGALQKGLQLLGLRPLADLQPDALERLFDGGCFGLWLFTLGVLALAAWRGWGGRWLRFASALYLLPALCTSTQILARFPDYTRVWIDLSSLALLALLASRSWLLKPWLALSALMSAGYGLGYLLLAP
ncbi:MAG: glycosyltransferase family 4 protein [Prochlorococcaceae cyanobacterium]